MKRRNYVNNNNNSNNNNPYQYIYIYTNYIVFVYNKQYNK